MVIFIVWEGINILGWGRRRRRIALGVFNSMDGSIGLRVRVVLVLEIVRVTLHFISKQGVRVYEIWCYSDRVSQTVEVIALSAISRDRLGCGLLISTRGIVIGTQIRHCLYWIGWIGLGGV